MEHTAELELEIESSSEPGVFAEALSALAELLDDADRDQTRASRRVAAEARDRPALLAAWLEELVFLAESEGFIAEELEEIELSPGALSSRISGRLGGPPPLVFRRSPSPSI